MTIAKIRNLSQAGVITDVSPFNLPANAFSMAVNARFENGSILRAPVFRRVPLTLAQSDPRFLTSDLPTTGFDTMYVGYLNGKVSSVKNVTETDVTISGFSVNPVETPYTSVSLGSVFYMNRADRVPWSKRAVDTAFQPLQNWDSTWRANLLRTCGGVLVALGLTKGAASFPTMVKTSTIPQYGTVPTSWDNTVTTNNATENILADMHGAITDACLLGTDLIIYGLNEAWKMTADGSSNVFRYDKLRFGKGAINANCSVEVDGIHYVFGPNDIWTHDGVSDVSIADQRVRKFIFSTINLQKAFRCFVQHDPNRKKIIFGFISGDPFLAFTPGSGGCNRSAVFDLVEKKWDGFDDLPYVFGATISNIDTTATYANITGTYDTLGGTYLDQEDSIKRNLVMLGDVSATYSLSEGLYAVDLQGPGSNVGYPVDTNATRPVTIIRDGIDLDELPEVEDNSNYKILDSIFPQAKFETGAQPLMISAGGANNYNDTVVYEPAQSYDADVFHQCDFFTAGRYQSVKITHNDYHYFNLSGLDLALMVTGTEG
jgi:hypothetical protein